MAKAPLVEAHLGMLSDVIRQVNGLKRPVESLLEATMVVANLRRCFSLAAGGNPVEEVTPPALAEIQKGVSEGNMDDETAKRKLLELLEATRMRIEAIGNPESNPDPKKE